MPDLKGWIGDAKFGFNELHMYFNNAKRLDVLEVGCGLGILLASLKEKYPNLNVEGIEPYKAGFYRLRAAKALIPKQIKVHNLNFENFKTHKKYDIIYSVNVFEHLANWKLYLEKAKEWLKPDGIIIILCPNYSFPYESHFKIPILLNKRLTFNLYKNKILNYEKKHNLSGLWHSLNFIKMRDLKKYCYNNEMSFKYCNDIFYSIIERLDDDEEFKRRQSFIGACAKIIKKIGLIKILGTRMFHLIHPYMKIEIKKNKEKNQ